jgi:transcriptional regulator with XRE-family HTH domain
MDFIFQKLKKSRELIQFTQKEAAEFSQLRQRDISDLENGQKKFIPNQYIQFLYIQGIDINSLFDDSYNPRLRKQNPEPIQKPTSNKDLLKIIDIKDIKLIELSKQIGKLEEQNRALRIKNGYNTAAEPE